MPARSMPLLAQRHDDVWQRADAQLGRDADSARTAAGARGHARAARSIGDWPVRRSQPDVGCAGTQPQASTSAPATRTGHRTVTRDSGIHCRVSQRAFQGGVCLPRLAQRGRVRLLDLQIATLFRRGRQRRSHDPGRTSDARRPGSGARACGRRRRRGRPLAAPARREPVPPPTSARAASSAALRDEPPRRTARPAPQRPDPGCG